MERMDAGGNPGRSWTLWEQRRTSSSQRTTGTGIIQTIPCFPLIFSHLLWSSPFPHTQTNYRTMVLLEFYLQSVVCAGTEPVEPGPCSLFPAPAQATCTSNLELQEGHTSSPVSAFPHPLESSQGFIGTRSSTPPPAPGRTGQTLLL